MTRAVKGVRILTPAERHELREGLAASGRDRRSGRWYACGHDKRNRVPIVSRGCESSMCRECARLSAARYRSRKMETKVSTLADHPRTPHPIPKAPVGKGAEGTRAERALALAGGDRLRDGEGPGC